MHYSPPGSSVRGILQARILEWVAMPSSKGSSWLRDQTPHLLCLLHWQVGSLPLAQPGEPLIEERLLAMEVINLCLIKRCNGPLVGSLQFWGRIWGLSQSHFFRESFHDYPLLVSIKSPLSCSSCKIFQTTAAWEENVWTCWPKVDVLDGSHLSEWWFDWQALSPMSLHLGARTRLLVHVGVMLSPEVRRERRNEAAGLPSTIALLVPNTQLPAKQATRGWNPTCLQASLCLSRGLDLMGYWEPVLVWHGAPCPKPPFPRGSLSEHLSLFLLLFMEHPRALGGSSSEWSLPAVFVGGFPGGSVSRESTCQSSCQCRRCRFDLWVGKIPWRRVWQPTPIFLPGKFHGQKNLGGYSPWGHKELDMTELACTHMLSLWEPIFQVVSAWEPLAPRFHLWPLVIPPGHLSKPKHSSRDRRQSHGGAKGCGWARTLRESGSVQETRHAPDAFGLTALHSVHRAVFSELAISA